MKTIHARVKTGWRLWPSCVLAVMAAKKTNAIVKFTFNGVPLVATPKTSPYTLRWEFNRSYWRYNQ